MSKLTFTGSGAGMSADDFNDQYPVGTPVTVFPATESGPGYRTYTRTPAWELNPGDPVISVDGYAGGIALESVFFHPADFTEGEEWLVTPNNMTAVDAAVDAYGVFAKPFSQSVGREMVITGIRVGHRPGQVLAFWGDTLVRKPDGSFVIRVVVPKGNKRENSGYRLALTVLSPEEAERQDKLAEEMAKALDEATCKCKDVKKEDHTLSVEEGRAIVRHTVCGSQPWYMFDDWTDCMDMQPVPVTAHVSTGCSGYPCYSGSCDCGPEIDLTLRKDTGS